MPASAASNRPRELTERLGAEGEARLKAMREVKNQIIGNKTKKMLYLNLGAVPKIVSALASAADSGSDAALIVQSAAAIGSFACGVEDGVRAVLDAGAVPQLLRILSHPNEKVVDAGARSLRMIFQSKLAPKYDVLQEKNMKFLVSLLNSDNENVTELSASIIAHSCEANVEQKALCDAGALNRLVTFLEGSSAQRDACLDSIAAILRNNPEVSTKFACIENGRALSSLIGLMRDRSPRTRLLACICLIAVAHASPSYVQELNIKTKIILILIELLEEPGRAGDDAPFALLDLIADKEELHKQAISINAIEKFCNFLHTSPIQARRLQGILLVLAELCSKLEKCRSQLILPEVLNIIANALKHESGEVCIAACSCIQSISRSVKNLSAGLLCGETIVNPLVQLLHETSIPVQVAALDAICNVAVDFRTRKSAFFNCGGVKQLVQLSRSMDPTLRLRSIWALRNMAFLADRLSKEGILTELTVSMLAVLISDSEHLIQEQAMGLVNNLIDGHSHFIEQVFQEGGIIINAVAKQLRYAFSSEVCIQGMILLSNIAAGSEFHKEAVMSYLIPAPEDGVFSPFLIKFMQNKHNLLRTAAVWCIVNLTYQESVSSSRRASRLREAGIFTQLKTMVNDSCLDCKFRVRMALEQFVILENSST